METENYSGGGAGKGKGTYRDARCAGPVGE